MFNHSQLFAGKMHEFFTLWIRRDDGRGSMKAGRHVQPQRGEEKKPPQNSDIKGCKAFHQSCVFAVNNCVHLSECVLSSVFFFLFCQKQIRAPTLTVTLPRALSSCIGALGRSGEIRVTAAANAVVYQSRKHNLKVVWVHLEHTRCIVAESF